jgi:hypothetical protein
MQRKENSRLPRIDQLCHHMSLLSRDLQNIAALSRHGHAPVESLPLHRGIDPRMMRRRFADPSPLGARHFSAGLSTRLRLPARDCL